MNRVGAIDGTRDLNLPACDHAIAEDANALIIERDPLSPWIGCTKDGKFLFWKECLVQAFAGRGMGRGNQ